MAKKYTKEERKFVNMVKKSGFIKPSSRPRIMKEFAKFRKKK